MPIPTAPFRVLGHRFFNIKQENTGLGVTHITATFPFDQKPVQLKNVANCFENEFFDLMIGLHQFIDLP